MSNRPSFNMAEFRDLQLPDEPEIMSAWVGDVEKPTVSILCTTYNQVAYLEDAIRGFLLQETEFPFEVVIHDDCSTDGCQKIIKHYADLYPNIIRPVLQNRNQYSRGKKPMHLCFGFSRGEFLALCEGDDFWCSSDKLRKQVSQLKSHQDINIAFHSVLKLKGEEMTDDRGWLVPRVTSKVPVSLVILKGGGYIPTPSILVRREVLEGLPNWYFKNTVGDYVIQVLGASPNCAIYLPEAMSVYRVQAEGSWTNRQKENLDRRVSYLKMLISAYRHLDRHLNKKYRYIFVLLITRVQLEIHAIDNSLGYKHSRWSGRLYLKIKILYIRTKKMILSLFGYFKVRRVD